ncbi:monovalent cation:proton antiporter family protein [Bacillus marinisedimentorum]|uniref:monovalent cation:proton antiporter family protein n=1 Tax=Bacillus marinisedimentorum TaxID=1821260 RepID=UPI00087250D1|nr:cation:proton antiporter family protein [Bacillus marinisedimentorum]
MDHHSMTSLILVLAIAFFIPIFLQRFHLRMIPVVVAEIAAGLIVGQSGLNLVQEDPWLELLAALGFLFLMFLSGLEISFEPKAFKEENDSIKPHPFLLGLLMFGLIVSVSYVLSLTLVWFGLIKEAPLMALIITTISLGVVLPVLKERQLLGNHYGQTLLMTATVADFATMLLLTAYLMIRAGEPLRIPLLLLLFIAMFVIYRSVKRTLHIPFIDKLMKTATVQLGTRGVFALVLLFAGLSERLGAEAIFGAFLAGIIISLLRPQQEFRHQLDSFGYGFLIPIFFVMVGVRLDLQAIIDNKTVLLLMPVLLVYMYIAKLVPSIVLARWYSWKKALAAGLLSTSKLSLVIAAARIAYDAGIISSALNGALILVAVTTCLVSPVAFNRLVPNETLHVHNVYSIIGANSLTLPLSLELSNSPHIVKVYSDHPLNRDETHNFEVVLVSSFQVETLEKKGAFNADKLIAATADDGKNAAIAGYAREHGIHDVVAKLENSSIQDELGLHGIRVFSPEKSSAIVLRTLVDQPAMLTLLSEGPHQIREILIGNHFYDNMLLKQIQFLGDALILHIVREGQFILPHGDTRLKEGDHLLISGNPDTLDDISHHFA